MANSIHNSYITLIVPTYLPINSLTPDLYYNSSVWNILIYSKILGAMAKRGSSIEELLHMGRSINGHLASIGISATSCNVPGEEPSFLLQKGEFEFGVGLHGEAGTSRIKVLITHAKNKQP